MKQRLCNKMQHYKNLEEMCFFSKPTGMGAANFTQSFTLKTNQKKIALLVFEKKKVFNFCQLSDEKFLPLKKSLLCCCFFVDYATPPCFLQPFCTHTCVCGYVWRLEEGGGPPTPTLHQQVSIYPITCCCRARRRKKS